MKKIFTLLAAVTLIASAGCSDNKEESSNASVLYGSWINGTKYDLVQDEWVLSKEKPDLRALDFHKDGTVSVDDCGEALTYTYSLDGKKLQIKESAYYSFRFTILTATSSVLELHEKDIDDDYKVVYTREPEAAE